MKKVLSLMLALAVVFTTLALPVAVSADDATAPQITVSLVADNNGESVHPGDQFNVKVNLTSDKDVTLDSYELRIGYDSADFTASDLNEFTNATSNWGYTGSYLQLFNQSTTELTANTAKEVGSVKFTVSENAALEESEVSLLTQYGMESVYAYSSTETGEKTEGNQFIGDGLSVNVSANTSNIIIDGKAYEENKLYINKSGVTFKVTGTNIKTVKYKEKSATDYTDIIFSADAAEITTPLDAGEYEVVVEVLGSTAKTYKFRVSKEVVSGEISLVKPSSEIGYKAGETVEVPVKIAGIGTDKKGMASFDLSYDKTRLELDTSAVENVSYGSETEDGKIAVSFGTASTGANFPVDGEGNFVTLKFTVKQDAQIGGAEVKIDNAQLTIKNATDDIVFENNTSSITNSKVSAIVVPDKYATVKENSVKNWVNNEYDVEIEPATAPETEKINFKYVVQESTPTELTQSSLENFYNGTGAITVTDNKVKISEEDKTYVIVSEFNGIYSQVAALVPGIDIFLDKTAPVINEAKLAAMSMESFAKNKEIDFADLATDKRAVDYSYKVGDSANVDDTDWKAVGGTSVEFSESTVGKLYVLATDAAGNKAVSTSTVEIKVDADTPILLATAGDDASDGTPIAITASDTTSNVTVKVYYKETALDEGTAVDASMLKHTYDPGKSVNETYKAQDSGFYFVTAVDEAGNEATMVTVQVTRASVSGTSTLSVKVGENLTEKANVFFDSNSEELKDYNGSNGTFGYVGIKVAAPAEGLKNTITVTKDLTNVELSNAADLEAEYTYAFTEKGAYELTVTTTHKTNASASASTTYKFTIADDQTKMVSPDGNDKYNVIDFVMIRKVANNAELNGIPTTSYGFSGRYAGDLNGDFTTSTDDVNAMITSITEGRIPGYYNFAIMNGTAAPTTDSEAE